MSLFNRALRPPPTTSDEAIERYLADLHAEIQPDPLFRRRLRTDAVNRFVAAREGIATPARAGIGGRQMGRIGRACLYASFTLGVSAASVMAASQEALPGDALYPLKQRIEQLRWDLVPDQLHGELAALALGERIEEMGRLADTGRMELALAMAPEIDRGYARLAGLANRDAAADARIERHLLVLQGLVDKLPATTRAAVEDLIETPDTGQSIDRTPSADPGATGGGAGTGPEPTATAGPQPTPGPDRTPRPDPSATPRPTPKPEHTQQGVPSPEDESPD